MSGTPPMKVIDLTGKRFGKLVVIKRSDIKTRRRGWLCKCDCGREKIVMSCHLTTGDTTTCGCSRRNGMLQQMIGRRFGKLVVIAFVRREKTRYYWLCRCDCGNEKIVRADVLTAKDTFSCGCQRVEKWKKYNEGKRSKLIGRRFSRLVVINDAIVDGHTECDCQCDCGNFKTASAGSLLGRNTQSCGCLHRDTASMSSSDPDNLFKRKMGIQLKHMIKRGELQLL